MPSYRYLREIQNAEPPPPPAPPQTPKQKAANWWHYHWGWVVAGVVLVAAVVFFVWNTTKTPIPDLRIGMISSFAAPPEAIHTLEESLADFVGDLNGDGTALVYVEQYTLSAADIAEDAYLAQSDAASTPSALGAYTGMANVVRLSTALAVGEPMIFLIEPSQLSALQQAYGIFATEGGGMAADASAAHSVALSDVNTLQNLGSVTLENNTVYNIDAHFGEFRLGMRGITGQELADQSEYAQLWQKAEQIFSLLIS